MKLSKQHILILVILLLLTACGFKLRGQISSLPFKTLYISAPGGNTIGMNLERAIGTSSTTKVVANAEDAEATLEVISATSERIILSLSGGGRVRDFNLLYRVRYRLYDKQNVEIVPHTEVTLTRVLPFLDAQILAKEAEERLLQKDMEADAIQQMMWRLSTIQR
ncbi:LPS-assembly lipoprotein LptE [Nitrosomonas oligotropha]|uniref:LPS-assembly lipoprotein LptE n=1 Tax=Nitrosomonas oligotropha TaxID=42354 RepID=A0A1H8N8K5_9PROT|nr:LPS assembly lipoprotein LptE [Nitrosomonas oligotropha]SDX06966.1 LPS-assembly lipoprotein [Nitrosomonas oligotropha]SEO25914.1 LPS-assembly lipoprotein [Nitrosomonas oligotropha]